MLSESINLLNKLIPSNSLYYISESFNRQRGLFLLSSLKSNSYLSNEPFNPIVAYPQIKLRLDRHCNHCFKSIKLNNLCYECSFNSNLYNELKSDNKDILNLKEYYNNYSYSEGLLHKLAYRICHEKREGYENTLGYLNTLLIPEIPKEAEIALKDDHELLYTYINNSGLKEIESFLTIEWYIRTLGVIHLNCITNKQGTALYDIPSFINHSCRPNIALEFNGFLVSIKTIRDVNEGEELFLDYSTFRQEFHDTTGLPKEITTLPEKYRKCFILKDTYGFDCESTCTCR